MNSFKFKIFFFSVFIFYCASLHSYSSEAYLSDVIIDIESYSNNIFNVDIDADTPDDNICETVSAKIAFYNNIGQFEHEIENSWQVCGPDFHPQSQIFKYDTSSVGTNANGFFACSSITLKGNSFIDSYNSSYGSYGDANNDSQGNLYCNGSINLKGNAYVRGNATAHDINTQGNSYLEGSQNISQQTWDCFTSYLDVIENTVVDFNNNDLITTTTSGNIPFNPPDSLHFNISGPDSITLSEGIYYFESFTLNGNTTVNIDGYVIIYCQNTVSINGQCNINTNNDSAELAIYSFDNQIIINGNAVVKANLFSIRDKINIKGSTELLANYSLMKSK